MSLHHGMGRMGQEVEQAIRVFLSKIESTALRKRRQGIKTPKKRKEKIKGQCLVD